MANQDIAVVPLLSVRNGARAIEFYKTAFGAREVFRVDNEKGEVVGQLSVSQADFWLADESPQHGNFSPESLGGGTIRLLLILDDPDAAFERAVTAGAKAISAVGNQHGWRVGRVADPFGHHWEICARRWLTESSIYVTMANCGLRRGRR